MYQTIHHAQHSNVILHPLTKLTMLPTFGLIPHILRLMVLTVFANQESYPMLALHLCIFCDFSSKTLWTNFREICKGSALVHVQLLVDDNQILELRSTWPQILEVLYLFSALRP